MKKRRSEPLKESTAAIAQFTYPTLRPGRCLMATQTPHGQQDQKSKKRRDASVHIRQGELDGACGQHCLLMALTIFGVQPRGGWDPIFSRSSGPHQALSTTMKTNFFSGTFIDDLIKYIDAAPIAISHVACRSRSNRSAHYVERFCLKHLRRLVGHGRGFNVTTRDGALDVDCGS